MIRDLYRSKKPIFSFEVFPPKKEDAFPALFEVLGELKALAPDFISVTYGAGGSRSKKTIEIASHIQNVCQIEALAHLTCVGCGEASVDDARKSLSDQGVKNILALRGDRPKDMTDEQYHSRAFAHASDMISFLKKSPDVCIAAACYPEKHFESPDMEADLLNLKKKTEAGADFLITQMFFDNAYFYRFLEKLDTLGIDLPVSAGIMPITAAKQLGTTVSLSGSSIPKALSDLVAKYAEKPEDLKKAGIDYAVNQIRDLSAHGADGIHIYTMNKSETARAILTGL